MIHAKGSRHANSKKHPILITACHASAFVPGPLRKLMLLSDAEIKRESDLFTDQIFDVPGAHFMNATISRLVTDLNRAPDHIEMQYQLANDGAVVSINEHGEQIYKEPPSLEAIFQRIETYHHPFHKAIERLKPGIRLLIDGHSMTSVGPATKNDSGQVRPDICIGNMHFTTCTRHLTFMVAEFFEKKGLRVRINKPYEGRYIIGHHASRTGMNGLTIEINRALYMNEKTLRPRQKEVQKLKAAIAELVQMLNQEFLTGE